MRFLSCVVLLLLLPHASRAFDDTENPLRIGVSAAQSGPVAEFGQSFVNGIQMAVEESPEEFSSITFIYEDDRYDALTAVRVFQSLRSDRKVDMILVAGVTPSEAMAPLAERYQLPLIANCQNPSSALGKLHVVRFINYTEQYVLPLMTYFRKNKFRRIVLVKADAPYYDAYVEALKNNVKPNEHIDVLDGIPMSEQDFRSLILRIKGKQYDAVGVFLFPGQIATFFRQAAQLKLGLPSFGTDIFESRDELARAEGLMEGAVYSFHVVTKEFATRYREKYGNDDQIGTAANGYDLARLIATQVAEFPNRPNSAMLLSALTAPGEHFGVTGSYRYQESESGGQFFEFPIFLKTIKSNDFQPVEGW